MVDTVVVTASVVTRGVVVVTTVVVTCSVVVGAVVVEGTVVVCCTVVTVVVASAVVATVNKRANPPVKVTYCSILRALATLNFGPCPKHLVC